MFLSQIFFLISPKQINNYSGECSSPKLQFMWVLLKFRSIKVNVYNSILSLFLLFKFSLYQSFYIYFCQIIIIASYCPHILPEHFYYLYFMQERWAIDPAPLK